MTRSIGSLASTTSPSCPRRSSRGSSRISSTGSDGEAVYLDPDIRIYGSLAGSREARGAARHRAHAAHDAALSAGRPQVDGFFILAAGVYNLGFIGVGGERAAVSRLVVGATRREALATSRG